MSKETTLILGKESPVEEDGERCKGCRGGPQSYLSVHGINISVGSSLILGRR